MAVQKNCTEHTIEINGLKKDMETRIRHEEKLSKAISNIEDLVDKLNETTFRINTNLEHFKDVPDRVRKLEDKSIVISMVEKGLWFIVGIGISVLIQNSFIATKEDNNYKIEKHK